MDNQSISKSSQKSREKKKTEVPLYRGPVTVLTIPAFQTCTQSALIRANNKPPVELVVAYFMPKSDSRGIRKTFGIRCL